VDAGAQEDFDLDFKLTAYGRTDHDRRALAGDVAALANTAGGVIAVGIDEDDQARATDAPGIAVTDTEVGRIHQVVASYVSPMPHLDVLGVLDEPAERGVDAEPNLEDDADSDEPAPAQGFILIAVPRSPSAPHAVLVNDALRYPKRNGATTRYLSEPEVAAAYRDRLSGAARQDQRVVEVEQQAIMRMDVSDPWPWVVVTLVPDLPGDLDLSRDVFQSFERQIVGSPAAIVDVGAHFQRANVGRRRLLADAAGHDSLLARWVAVELHSDGAGVYGLMVPDLNMRDRADVPNLPRLALDESIVVAILSGLLHLARHARDRTAAGGNAVVRAQLHPVSHLDLPTAIGHRRGFGTEARSRPVVTVAPSPAESVAALDDIAQPGPELVIVAAAMADEIGQAFGVPEMGQLSRDGELRRRYWGRDWQAAMVAWAERNGITVTDAVLG
jgi:hypothetical protein